MKKALWIAFHAFNWLLILYFWYSGSGSLLSQGVGSALVACGRLLGLLAGYSVLTQFFLMGRSPLIERVFGLDKLARMHQISGRTAFFFLIGHPVLLLLGYMQVSSVSFWGQVRSLLNDFQYTLWALIALGLFITAIAFAITLVRRRLAYELWYGIHLLVYVAVFLAFWHQISEGTDLLSSTLFYSYWIALYIFVFANQIMFRFARPVYRYFRHAFYVTRLERESPTVTSVYISGKNLEQFSVRAGQFMFFRFLQKRLWWQAHPFSMSMMPNGKEIRISVKALGDYTNQIKDLVPGTKVFIDGPYGVFTEKTSRSSKVLLVAGGIGITPVRSLTEEMLSKGKDVVLVYGNRNEQEIVFRKELDELSKRYHVKIIHVLSEQESFAGEKGRVDEEKIRRLVPDAGEREVYVCGPVPMMNGLIELFQKLGVPKRKIHFERFAL